MKVKSDSLYSFKGNKIYVSTISETYDSYEIGEENQGQVYIYYYNEWDGYGPMWNCRKSVKLESFADEDPVLIEENFSDSFVSP